eukprot:10061941-Ditylum_brightwellii.AAC.1
MLAKCQIGFDDHVMDMIPISEKELNTATEAQFVLGNDAEYKFITLMWRKTMKKLTQGKCNDIQ